MKISPMKVELLDFMGSDNSIVNAARVSFHKEASQYTEEQNAKLIQYLCKHNHWSPLAHAFLSFRIKAPIFVARQLVKHQVGLAWNEVSRRYVDDEPEFWFPEVWRGKPVNAKQGSSGTVEEKSQIDEWCNFYKSKDIVCLILDWYKLQISNGMAPEQARMILPQNTMTEWIWSGSLAAFARVCKLRLDPHAQQETQEIAKQIDGLVPDNFKISWKALLD